MKQLRSIVANLICLIFKIKLYEGAVLYFLVFVYSDESVYVIMIIFTLYHAMGNLLFINFV